MFWMLGPQTSKFWYRVSFLMSRPFKTINLTKIFDFPTGELLGPKFQSKNGHLFSNQDIFEFRIRSLMGPHIIWKKGPRCCMINIRLNLWQMGPILIQPIPHCHMWLMAHEGKSRNAYKGWLLP